MLWRSVFHMTGKWNIGVKFPPMGTIGLALESGAVLGAPHIGVLRALEEFNISIDFISGTSIGAFIGALYAFGK